MGGGREGGERESEGRREEGMEGGRDGKSNTSMRAHVCVLVGCETERYLGLIGLGFRF
jgi:hypothetical protein